MKSIYISTFIFLLVAICAASCEDNLDIEQQGVTTPSVYKTGDDTQVKQFISAVYAMVLGNSFEAILSGGQASYRSVNYEMSRMSAETADYYAYNEGADASTYSYIWYYYYKVAYWCNMIIDGLSENNVASESVKTRVIAEARVIRAIAMMNLVQLYGNPPLADHVMNGSEGNTPAVDSWNFIETELNEAATDLPSKSGLGGQETIGGRLTKEAAYAYLGKAQLWQKKYDDAAKTLHDKVISTGKYLLNPNFATYNSSNSDFSDENIWEYNFSDEGSVSNSQDGCFDVICFSPVVTYWYHTYGNVYMGYGMGAHPSKSFAEFMTSHEVTNDGTLSPRYQGTLIDCVNAHNGFTAMLPASIPESEGYIKLKDLCLADDLLGELPWFFSKRNVAYMRYAEVLLNYAEAVAMGGTEGTITGLQALNLVRQRAGLADAPALDMNNVDYGVKAERRAELYGEGHRFIDLVRWGDAASELADCGKIKPTFKATMTNVSAGETTVSYIVSTEITTASTGGPGFVSGKNELFPIPTTDRDNNPNLEQNPGW